MASQNKHFIIGNLGGDPEVRVTPSGTAVANFTVATTEKWNDKQGNAQERTEWHRIVVWGKLADLCGKYLTKGRQIHIEGKVQTRSWDDRDGVKRYTTETVAREIIFLGGRPANAPAPQDSKTPAPMGNEPSGVNNYNEPPMDEEIPF